MKYKIFRNSARIFGDTSRLKVGHKCELTDTLFNLQSGDIYIGDFVFFSYECKVLTGTHDITVTNRDRQRSIPTSGRDIHIGSGVWVGAGAIILGPCNIGNNSVIAAASVVLPGEYESDTLFAGNPAVAKKKINLKK